MNKKNDTRFLKTHSLINNTFIELMDTVGFSKITVKKIIDTAQINRSTFYSHYLDKFDLLDKIQDNLLIDLKNIASNNHLGELTSNNFNFEFIACYIQNIVNYMYQNGKLFALLIKENDNSGFINKFANMIKDFWSEKNINTRLSVPQDYVLAAMTGMMSNLIIEWVKKDFEESPDEFSNIVMNIIRDIPQNIITKKDQ